jgi:hypothetical protein
MIGGVKIFLPGKPVSFQASTTRQFSGAIEKKTLKNSWLKLKSHLLSYKDTTIRVTFNKKFNINT